VPEADRRPDLYRSQETIPSRHPNGYEGPGLDLRDSRLREGYQPNRATPPTKFAPGSSEQSAPMLEIVPRGPVAVPQSYNAPHALQQPIQRLSYTTSVRPNQPEARQSYYEQPTGYNQAPRQAYDDAGSPQQLTPATMSP